MGLYHQYVQMAFMTSLCLGTHIPLLIIEQAELLSIVGYSLVSAVICLVSNN